MDSTDVRIIRELYQPQSVPPFGPVAKSTFEMVSKRLGVSRETVRTRVKKLQASGALLTPKLQLNPSIIGMRAWALGFDVPNQSPESKRRVVHVLRSVEDTLIVFNFVGNFVGMMLYAEDDQSLKSKMELITRISQMQNPVVSEVPFPPCEMKLSTTDWRIISALQRDIEASFVDISRRLKVSPRTVKRRISKMNDALAVYSMLSGDNSKLQDATEVAMMVFHTNEDERGDADRQILEITDDFTFFAGLFKSYSHFGMFLPSAHKSREILEAVQKLKGVREARIYIVDERFEMMEVLAAQVERKLSDLGLSSR
jgi:DNA-binding Lrp family transcriptional regulator